MERYPSPGTASPGAAGAFPNRQYNNKLARTPSRPPGSRAPGTLVVISSFATHAYPLGGMGSDALEALDEMTAEELRALVRALAPSFDAEQRALLQERLAARDREPDEAAVAPADLAATARRTRSFRDLRAWCRALEEAGDWRGARAAAEEAAQLIAPHPIGPATFLDDAALAAQQLDADDLDALLERAWAGRAAWVD